MTIWIVVLSGISIAWLSLWIFRVWPLWIKPTIFKNSQQSINHTVSIIIPARNAADTLPELFDDLVDEGPKSMEIIVVDDCSSDNTDASVRTAMQNDPRIRLIEGTEKPDSWAGKCWAIDQAAQIASGEWLVFCDADISVTKGTFDLAFNLIDDEKLDCLSIIPAMKPHSLSVSLLIACMSVARTLLFRPAEPDHSGIVQGAFLIVKRSAYDAVGGHNKIKCSLLEDVRLGQNLTNAGFRVKSCPGYKLVDTQMYGSFHKTCEGMTKHLFAILDFSSFKTVSAIILNGMLLVFPIASMLVTLSLLASGNTTVPLIITFFASFASIALMYLVILSITRTDSLSILSGLLVPFSIFMLAYVLLLSIYAYRRGHIIWKERMYPAGEFGLKKMKNL